MGGKKNAQKSSQTPFSETAIKLAHAYVEQCLYLIYFYESGSGLSSEVIILN